jgi:hypothetical protein
MPGSSVAAAHVFVPEASVSVDDVEEVLYRGDDLSEHCDRVDRRSGDEHAVVGARDFQDMRRHPPGQVRRKAARSR